MSQDDKGRFLVDRIAEAFDAGVVPDVVNEDAVTLREFLFKNSLDFDFYAAEDPLAVGDLKNGILEAPPIFFKEL